MSKQLMYSVKNGIVTKYNNNVPSLYSSKQIHSKRGTSIRVSKSSDTLKRYIKFNSINIDKSEFRRKTIKKIDFLKLKESAMNLVITMLSLNKFK